jgi:hypothetical protein
LPKTANPLKEQISEQYHEYLNVFTIPHAGQLPPYCEWDLKVTLISEAPASISYTPYPLSKAEKVFQEEYIKENLARGFIQHSNSPYSTLVFYN